VKKAVTPPVISMVSAPVVRISELANSFGVRGLAFETKQHAP
jgi:hypothetical protein